MGLLNCACGTKYFPLRYMLALMCLLGVIVGYGQRVSLSLAITTMTNKTVSASKSCPLRNTTFMQRREKIHGGVIPWTNNQQNVIIGAFYSGYFLGHIPVGLLCDWYGGRYVFFGGILISTVISLLTPVIVINTPWQVAVFMRSLLGLGQSVIYPAISSLYAKWVPLEERSLLGAFSFAANALGVIFGGFLSGIVIHVLRHWHSAFYIWGGLGVLWCIFYIIYVYSEPNTHPFITQKEKEFLSQKMIQGRKMKIPWLGFLTSLPLWAIVIGEIGHDFTIFTLANNLPKYLSDVLHYDIAENTLASSLPYAAQWLGGVLSGKITDYCIKKRGGSIIWSRRVLTTIGVPMSAAFLVAVGYIGCNGAGVIAMFSMTLFFKGPFYAGLKVNHLDLSVNFPGIIMAIYNGIGALAGWISPAIINQVAPNNTLNEWKIVFWIIFIVTVVTTVFYNICCSTNRQSWDVPESDMEDFLRAEEERKAKKKEEKERKKQG